MKERDVSIASIKHAAIVTTLSVCSLIFSACTRHASPDEYQGSRVTEANQSIVLDRGVQVLQQHRPGELIRGTLDPIYDLHDFQVAASELAMQDPKAAYIMGWLCENGDRPESNFFPKLTINISQIDLAALGFDQNKVLAGKWYTISSERGLGAGSVQMALLLQKSSGANRDKCLALANDFLRKGKTQGDGMACVYLGYSYAYGLGVQADGKKAWDLLAKIIYGKTAEEADAAIMTAVQCWKDGKLTPSAEFSRGFADAYAFARSFDAKMSKSSLDNLYQYHGFTPDPYPQWRKDLAEKIRAGLNK